MTKPAIKVQGLWKQYILGAYQRSQETFREMLVSSVSAPFRRFKKLRGNVPEEQRFWSLKEIDFDVYAGQVVGIIGQNGAGKTTLLKILSRITAPTRGRAEIRGRVASLLEIGAGFHIELTGRENIYLNGVILGMTRREIKRRFDDIVAFAEVEKFLDTPVKRYSSGMYVRLAFAVAAHLDPDILLVDEVLAVGDAAFQKRCLGKIGDVAEQGRAVLFVSHNMQAIQSLCDIAIELESGCVVNHGLAESVVSKYLSAVGAQTCEKRWPKDAAPGNEEVKLTAVRTRSVNGGIGGTYPSNKGFCVEMKFLTKMRYPSLCVGFDLVTPEGTTVLRSYQTDLPPDRWPAVQFGHNRWYCTIPPNLLSAGTYYVCPKLGFQNMRWIIDGDPVARFVITLDDSVSPFWSTSDESSTLGVIAPILKWEATD